jgi:uncharacterized protein
MEIAHGYTAFAGDRMVAAGALQDIVPRLKRMLGKAGSDPVRIFSDLTGGTLDFNFHGTEKDVLKRLETFVGGSEGGPASQGPGRPKLGVVSREVSLLPRQWEWLALQPGGASAVLRRLVDEAKRKAAEGNAVKQCQERAYRFMTESGGDLPGYEEAIRALYRKDKKSFLLRLEGWPPDLKTHILRLAAPVFA